MEPRLWTFFASMIPIIELRGTIPVAIQFWGLSPYEAFFWAVLGNIVPNFFILSFLGPVSKWLSKHFPFWKNFFEKLFEKTRHKHTETFERVGALFLITFIAIPLPGTGSWTGSLIAWIFNIPYWKAMLLVTIGVIGSGLLITAGYSSIIGLMNIVTNSIR